MNLNDDPTNTTPSNQARTPGNETRSAILAEFEELDTSKPGLEERTETPPAETPPPVSDEEEAADAEDEADENEAEEDADGDEEEEAETDAEDEEEADDDEEDEDVEDEDEEEEEEERDRDLEKRLAKTSRAERRAKARIAKEQERFRAAAEQKALELQRRDEALAEREKAVGTVEGLSKSLWTNPSAALEKLGISGPEEAERLSQHLFTWARGEAGDPKYQEAARREARARETSQEVSGLKGQLEELQNEIRRRDEQARVDAYLSKIERSVDEHVPKVQSALQEDPAQGRELITLATDAAWKRFGREPTPAEILRVAEALATPVNGKKRRTKKKTRVKAKKKQAAPKPPATEPKTLEQEREEAFREFMESAAD